MLDLQAMHSDDPHAWNNCVRAAGDLASRFGFFYICNHDIPMAAIDRVYAEASLFFNADEEEKMRAYIGHSPNHRGYVPTLEKGTYADETPLRFYEAFDSALDLSADDPDFASHHHLLGPNLWPADRPAFREAITDYYVKVSALGRRLCEAIEQYLGAPKALTSMMRKPVAQLRVIHYLENNMTVEEKGSSMGAHTDYECLTILHQSAEGLQVHHPELGWFMMPVIEGTLVVLVGDMLEAFSNGTFRSPLHRVIHHQKERFSLPYFVATDFDALIQPHASCVSEQRPASYEPIVAGHHLLGQLLRDFPYLRSRHRRGELPIDFEIPTANPFEERQRANQTVQPPPPDDTASSFEPSLHN